MELRPVVGYEGLYSVTRDGRVWSEVRRVPRGKGFVTIPGKCLQQSIGSHGYFTVQFFTDARGMHKPIHRVLAEAWMPRERPEASQVNHKNGVKTDNRIENLEWVTQSENMQHAYDIGLHGRANKLTDTQAKEALARVASGASQREVANEFGVTQCLISSLWLGKTYKHIERTV